MKKPTNIKIPNNPNSLRIPTFRLNFIGSYFTISVGSLLILGLIFTLGFLVGSHVRLVNSEKVLSAVEKKDSYWLVLHRKSQVELLYKGVPGSTKESSLVKTFIVKTGVPNQRPTPLPSLVGREYWVITQKSESSENPETAPYFLTLNVPVGEEAPFGPTPYTECVDEETGKNVQCNWELPGAFGLHGVNGDLTRISFENEGSSGCIRHSDEDITYLYNLLDPLTEEIRYYIQDV